jgi:hypothetical protein
MPFCKMELIWSDRRLPTVMVVSRPAPLTALVWKEVTTADAGWDGAAFAGNTDASVSSPAPATTTPARGSSGEAPRLRLTALPSTSCRPVWPVRAWDDKDLNLPFMISPNLLDGWPAENHVLRDGFVVRPSLETGN